MPNPIYALILAGGSGERFWPLSRRARPKQLLRLVANETLLEETVARLDGLVPRERILILTNVEQEAAVRELLPDLPKENIVAEPAKRDTAAAVALGAGWVALRDHSATMLVLPADHVIKDTRRFPENFDDGGGGGRGNRRAGHDRDQTDLGVSRLRLHRAGRRPFVCAVSLRTSAIHRVVRFREKPNADLAESFLRKGNFRWNAGMFVWSVPTVLSEFNRHTPELASFISQIRAPGQFRENCCASVSASCRRFLSITRSWKRPIASWSWRRLSIGTTSGAGARWRSISRTTRKATRPTAQITTLDSTNNIVFESRRHEHRAARRA